MDLVQELTAAYGMTAPSIVFGKLGWDKETNTYWTGTGQKLGGVHAENPDCMTYGCVVHNPTDPNQSWATHWRSDRGLMERICPCGVGHPDRDDIAWKRRTYGDAFANAQAVHGCCGCCE